MLPVGLDHVISGQPVGRYRQTGGHAAKAIGHTGHRRDFLSVHIKQIHGHSLTGAYLTAVIALVAICRKHELHRVTGVIYRAVGKYVDAVLPLACRRCLMVIIPHSRREAVIATAGVKPAVLNLKIDTALLHTGHGIKCEIFAILAESVDLHHQVADRHHAIIATRLGAIGGSQHPQLIFTETLWHERDHSVITEIAFARQIQFHPGHFGTIRFGPIQAHHHVIDICGRNLDLQRITELNEIARTQLNRRSGQQPDHVLHLIYGIVRRTAVRRDPIRCHIIKLCLLAISAIPVR